MMPVLVQSQHLDRDVPGRRVLFQMVEHCPSQHVRQEHVERDGGGMELARQRQRLRAAHRHQNLESLVVRQVAQNAGIVRIVFDDQQDRIVGLQVRTIVRDALNRQLQLKPADSWRGSVTSSAVRKGSRRSRTDQRRFAADRV